MGAYSYLRKLAGPSLVTTEMSKKYQDGSSFNLELSGPFISMQSSALFATVKMTTASNEVIPSRSHLKSLKRK